MTYLLDLCDLGCRHVIITWSLLLPVTLPVRCTITYCRVLTARASTCCSPRASSSASSANFCFLKVCTLCTSAPTFALLSNSMLFRRVTGQSVTMKASNHAWMTFAFLPIVKFIVHPDFQSILSVQLWHACMDKAFAQCKEATMNGCYMADPHGCLCWSFPLLVAWTANLPEQHLISAIVNNASPLSCATPNQFGDNTCQPPRHGHETLRLIHELTQCVDPWQLDNFQKAAKAIGLSGVHCHSGMTGIWPIPSISSY
jgi:hypothetical protein